MTELKGSRASSFIRRPDTAVKAVLFYGPDEGLVRERAQDTVKALVGSLDDPFNVVKLDDETLTADPGRLPDEAQAISLMGGRRAIWVRSAGSGLARALAVYLADAPGDGLIVAEAGSLRKGDRLRQLFEGAANAVAIACYADSEADLRELVKQALADEGATIAPDAMQHLLTLLGGDRLLSRAEIGKLALYARGRGEVSLEDVVTVCGDASALALDDLLDRVFEGDVEGADLRYARLIASGTPPAVLVVAAANHAASLQRLSAQLAPGRSAESIVRAARPPIFFKRQASMVRQLAIWDRMSLASAADTIAEAELRTREIAALAEAIAGRALLSLSRRAQTGRLRRA